MGKIKPDVVGLITKSIGNLVYYRLAGENCVRSKSKEPYTSNTPAQQLQHAKFGDMTHLASVMKYAAEVGFPQRKRGLSAANAFHKANKKCCKGEIGGETTIDYEHIQCSSGSLYPSAVSTTLDAETTSVTFTAKAMPEERSYDLEDTVYGVVLDKVNMFCRLVEVCKRGVGGTLSVELSEYWNMESLEMYTFTIAKDGKSASRTIYVTV